jgi:hypothetical protein
MAQGQHFLQAKFCHLAVTTGVKTTTTTTLAVRLISPLKTTPTK